MKELLQDTNIGIEHIGPSINQPYSEFRDGNFSPTHRVENWIADHGKNTIRGGGGRKKRREIKAINRTVQELQTKFGPSAATLSPDGESFTVANPEHMENAFSLMKQYTGKDATRI